MIKNKAYFSRGWRGVEGEVSLPSSKPSSEKEPELRKDNWKVPTVHAGRVGRQEQEAGCYVVLGTF